MIWLSHFWVFVPKNTKTLIQKKICTSVFNAALFTMCSQDTETTKVPINKWIKKIRYIYLICILWKIHCIWASQVVLMVKNLSANVGDTKSCGFNPWVRKIPWRRIWQPTPGFLPEKFHGQRNLGGYSPWSYRELNTNKQLSIFYMLTQWNITQPLK